MDRYGVVLVVVLFPALSFVIVHGFNNQRSQISGL